MPRWAWVVGAFAGVLLMSVQMRAFYLDELAQSPQWRPTAKLLCQVTLCELPERRGRFTVGSSNIVFHPNAPAAIRISTELRNLEKFPQGYPELVVTLTDKLGKVVGRRIFAASEYLADPTRRVQPETLTLVNLDVAEPVRSAIGFEVDIVSSR